MLAAKEAGYTPKQIAHAMGLATSTVYNTLRALSLRAAAARGAEARRERRLYQMPGAFRTYRFDQVWTPKDQFEQFKRERSRK